MCIADGTKWVTDKDVTRTTGFLWWKTTTKTREFVKTKGPDYGDVCRVVDVRGDSFLRLRGWEEFGYYAPQNFRPIDDLHEQLERIEKEGAPAELHEAHAFQLLNKCTD